MGQLKIQASLSGLNSNDVYKKIGNFKNYNKYVDIVRSISVENIDQNTSISSWEIEFENGILRWKERDVFEDKDKVIFFEMIEGDIEKFNGYWKIIKNKSGCQILFFADYDLGINMLNDILDPIAGNLLLDTIKSILIGLFENIHITVEELKTLSVEEEC
ncbi:MULTISPECIES: SRPBCC family protein [Bacillaceae]|nr:MULTISPECIES: SRPBCC family protein [Bacillaceae]PDM39703.1 hypothetical protein CN643_03755 [Parageobacillus yumthangensis]RDV23810.1 hypothetical protein DXK91_00345 [Parageobacillus toebii]TXK90528.1 hypothetical protein FVE24_11120 [Parageobacillus sp. SY1]AEH49443.1 cyclase/dehydrase [Parageobacillus thermoglucosidasius C56-YS93]MEB3751935.1 hypothetical protein [Geobacillus icigianus]